ncbi:hypothetical protein Q2360_02935, partial [Escherichia coli]|nr:hypothetical protein [Escherichia coli]
ARILESQQIYAWMLVDRLPSNIEGRAQIKAWLVDNLSQMKDGYPFLEKARCSGLFLRMAPLPPLKIP